MMELPNIAWARNTASDQRRSSGMPEQAHAVNELSQDNPEIKRQILAGKTLLTKQQIGDLGEIAKTDREQALSRFLDLNENLCVKRSQGQPKKKPKLIDSIIDDANKTYPYQIGNKVEVVTQIGGWDIGARSESRCNYYLQQIKIM